MRTRSTELRLAAHVDRLGEEHPPIELASVDWTVHDPAAFSARFGHVLDYMARVELEVDRNVLEWRLDPTSPWRLPEAESLARNGGRVVLVCNEGYSSSLAAESLRRIGLHRATDLAGGVEAWVAAGLPVTDGPADVRR